MARMARSDRIGEPFIRPNIVTTNALLTACQRESCENSADIGLNVVNLMRESPCCSPGLITYSTSNDKLGRKCCFDKMRRLLKEMANHGLKPNLSTFTSMFATLVHVKHIDGVLDVIHDIDAKWVETDDKKFTCVINGASRRQGLTCCLEIFDMIMATEARPLNVIYAIFLQESVRSG